MKGRIQQESSSPAGLSRPVDAVVVVRQEDTLGGTERRGCGIARSSVSQTKPSMQRKHRPICRFYMSSRCKYGSQCKFYHPQPGPVVGNEEGDGQEKHAPKGDVNSERAPTDQSLGMFMEAVKSRPRVARPERVKCKTPADLLKVELEQLIARFPEDKHRIIENGKCGVVYRITFTPADPDWTFDFKTVDLLVDFPNEYPTEPLSIIVLDDQAMPRECISSINLAITDWLAAQVSGTLVLRPFLHWLDKVITMLVKDSILEDDDTIVTQVVGDDASEDDGVTAEDDEGDGGYEELETSEVQNENLHEHVHPTVAAKRGTEIRLKDLVLGQYVGTVIFPTVKLVAECTRCKRSQDMAVTAEDCVSNACSRCHASMSVTFHSCLIHAGSITLGYMDLLGCVAVDIILMHSNVTITCLECGRENTTRGFCYGQSMDVWCRRCHSKLTMYAEQCKFVQHQSRELNLVTSEVLKQSKPKQKKPVFKVGSPLPECGTCEHYKKSHRWLRFPCCGKAYPCDICHDLREDHPMERANRMICGYCSQEQVYTASKPCTLCGFGLAFVRHSTFWEGGQGCRNKVKMSRNDKHKFSQSNKTTSKHSERVGLQGKKNQNH